MKDIFEFVKKNAVFNSLEIHSTNDCKLEEFNRYENYILHILDLNNDLDNIFNSFHTKGVRVPIRKAEESELEFTLAEDKNGLVLFYEVYVKLRSRLGLPPLPYKFFQSVWKCLRPEGRLLIPVVKYKGIPISVGIVLRYKDTFYLEYAASEEAFKKVRPTHKLYWEVIKIAHKSNAKFIDFGRSSVANTSLIKFKEKWNAKPIPLYHFHYPRNKTYNFSYSNKKFLNTLNRRLPRFVLKEEGKIYYKYFL